MKTTKQQQTLKITVMKNKEFLLMDLRKVINSDVSEILDILKMFEWTEDNHEARQSLLKYCDKLHKRWDDLYELEYQK
jgi:hypothetical protein